MSKTTIALILAFVAGMFAAGILSGSPEGAQAQEIVALKHFKCYAIRGDDPPHIVRLRDQFGIERKVDVGPAIGLCTPVRKKIIEGPPPLPFTGDHLVCYVIQPPHDPEVKVALRNQFSEQVADVGPSQLLCVPTEKRILR